MTSSLRRTLAKTLILTVCGTLLAVNAITGCSNQAPQDVPVTARTNTTTPDTPVDTTESAPPPEVADSAFYPLPDGGVDELVQFLNEMATKEPSGETDNERTADLGHMMEARVLAADRILAEANDETFRDVAAEAKMESLRLLSLIGRANAQEQRDAYVKELLASSNEQFVRIGRMAEFRGQVDELRKGAAPGPIVEKIDQLLKEETRDKRLFDVLKQAAVAIYQSGHTDEALVALARVGNAFHDNEDKDVAADAQSMVDEAEMLRLQGLLSAVFSSEEGAIEALTQGAREFLEKQPVGRTKFALAMNLAQQLEYSGNIEPSREIYEVVARVAADLDDPSLQEEVNRSVQSAQKRFGLIGQPFEVVGNTMGGDPFPWQDYAGKIVLVDFWATWCGPCLREIPNIKAAFEEYHERGFEVVGVNLDDEITSVEQFLQRRDLPWQTVVSADPEVTGFDNVNAVRCGVEGIPFLVLVGRDGKVAQIHVRGELLQEKLEELLAASPPSDDPASGSSESTDEGISDGDAAATENAASEAAPGDDTKNGSSAEATGEPASQADEETSDGGGETPPATDAETEPSDGSDGPLGEAETSDQTLQVEQTNPYLPPTGLSARELADLILSMQDKPQSIQHRRGFTEGIVAAADQLLSGEADDRFQVIAVLAKFQYLHRDACLGDEAADEQLLVTARALADDPREQIAAEVQFLNAERRAIEAAGVPAEEISDRVDEIKSYFSENPDKLSARHLRMASAAVELINRLDDGDARETQFAELGKLLGASADKQLTRYGRRIGRGPAAAEADLVGTSLQLEGVTADGRAFDWNVYRGNVVLVDFWATWCGPCRAMLPNLQELYDAQQQRGFEIVGISIDQDLDALAKFLEENQMPWTQLVGDGNSDLADRYGVRGIPTLMLVDRQGKVVATGHKLDAVRAQLMELLDSK